MFADWGLHKSVRRLKFQVDMGVENPKYCKCFRYGKFESEVIKKLCNNLRENDTAEDDTGPRGDLIGLEAKNHQADAPWW